MDLVEVVQYNGPGISKIQIKFEQLENKEILHLVVTSAINDKLKEAFEAHEKFVSAIIKILNGRFFAAEIDNEIRIELFLAIRRKSTVSVI